MCPLRSAPTSRCARPIWARLMSRQASRSPMANLLELDRVETTYGFSQVLHGISLAIAPGEVVTLLGRNGMGKTTTVRSSVGSTHATRGSIRFAVGEIRTLQS